MHDNVIYVYLCRCPCLADNHLIDVNSICGVQTVQTCPNTAATVCREIPIGAERTAYLIWQPKCSSQKVAAALRATCFVPMRRKFSNSVGTLHPQAGIAPALWKCIEMIDRAAPCTSGILRYIFCLKIDVKHGRDSLSHADSCPASNSFLVLTVPWHDLTLHNRNCGRIKAKGGDSRLSYWSGSHFKCLIDVGCPKGLSQGHSSVRNVWTVSRNANQTLYRTRSPCCSI